jgi:hypothetical protein
MYEMDFCGDRHSQLPVGTGSLAINTTYINNSWAASISSVLLASRAEMARRTFLLSLFLGLLAAANAVPFDFYYLVLMV